MSGSALRVHHALRQHPVQTVATAVERTALTVPTVTAAMLRLEKEGDVRKSSSKRRGRVFGHARCLDVLDEGTTTPSAD